MRGRLVDLTIGLNRKQRITVEVDRDYREDYERLKDAELDIEIKKHREKRSKSANAYFHVLVNKIAAERGRRNAAYGWLAQKMGLPVEQTHIGMFDVAQCRKAIHIIENETRGGSSHG